MGIFRVKERAKAVVLIWIMPSPQAVAGDCVGASVSSAKLGQVAVRE